MHEDPLFAEEWAARKQAMKRTWPPVEGSRSWDIDTEAEKELKSHASVTDSDDMVILKRFAESALDSLDGYDGQLGQYLQRIEITQPFARVFPLMSLIGPVMEADDIDPPVLEHLRDGVWETVPAGEWFVNETVNGPDIQFNNVIRASAYGYDYENSNYQARVRYTAGMGDKLSDLPSGLRIAVYIMAHRAFDYRGGMLPAHLLTAGDEVGRVIAQYRKVRDSVC